MEVVPWNAAHAVDCGVYFQFAADGRLLYIGQSLGISYRMAQHHWSGRRFAEYGAVYVPPEFMDPVETAYIHALKPPLNRKFPRPTYKAHAEMATGINALWDAAAVERRPEGICKALAKA